MKKIMIRLAVMMTVFVVTFGMTGTCAEASSRCAYSGCKNRTVSGSSYCSTHKCKYSGCKNCGFSSFSGYCSKHSKYAKKNSSGSSYSSSNKYTSVNHGYDSYDAGYEDVWLDEDYDWDRYQNDPDYAEGVDDAMDDEDW